MVIALRALRFEQAHATHLKNKQQQQQHNVSAWTQFDEFQIKETLMYVDTDLRVLSALSYPDTP